jgi:hypothetical protein
MDSTLCDPSEEVGAVLAARRGLARIATMTEGEPMNDAGKGKALPDSAQILGDLRSALPSLRERYGVQRLALFGSFARGEPTRRSDLDVLVEFDDLPLSLLQFIALEGDPSELLGLKVDLVERQALKPSIGRRVREELIPV